MPLVSVAIATFNQENFIEDTLASVLSQDFDDFEIVIGDDGSSDATTTILRTFQAAEGSRVKLHLATENRGITANCNEILRHCEGKYIAWLGGDDLMLPSKLRTQSRYMEDNENCVLSFHQLLVRDFDSRELIGYFNQKAYSDGYLRQYVGLGCINGGSSTMVRRSSIPSDGFSALLPTASDWYFWVQCLEGGGHFHYIDEVLGIYQRHNRNTSRLGLTVSQAEIDSLVSAWLVYRRHPHLRREVQRYLSDRLSSNRLVSDYNGSLLMSLRAAWSWRRATGLALSLISRGKIRP